METTVALIMRGLGFVAELIKVILVGMILLQPEDTLTIGSGKATKINEYLINDDGSCEDTVALTAGMNGKSMITVQKNGNT